MEQKKPSKISKNPILLIAVTVLFVLIVLSILVVCKRINAESQESTQGQGGILNLSETDFGTDLVMAYGVTGIGVTESEFPITGIENKLEIEKVCVASGDSIEVGTVLFELKEASVEAVLTELEETLRAADLAYRAGYLEYKQSLINAYYDKESTLLSGEYADEIYKETISGLYDKVKRAEEEWEEAKDQIAEYEAEIAGNTYYEEYKVEYYKEQYEENLEILKKRMEEWGVSITEVLENGNRMDAPRASVSGADADLHTQYVTVLSSLYKILEQNGKDYEQALAEYEEACENTDFELQTWKLQLSSLEKQYAEARENYETSILQAELTMETALSNAQKAESNYETTIEKAEADYEALSDAKKEAESNLAIFREIIKENCYCAQESGTVLRMLVRTDGEIGADSRLYTLRNAEEMTVTVSVDQKDIAKLQVGDPAMVQSTEGAVCNGIITAISPLSSSTGKIGITYPVTVTLDADSAHMEANETVYVYFEIGNGVQRNE